MDHHKADKWFIYGTRHRKENQLLGLVYKFGIKEVHGNMSNPFFEKAELRFLYLNVCIHLIRN